MYKRRMSILIVVLLVLISTGLAVSVRGQDDRNEKASGVIQYKLVPVPEPITQAQLQTVLTAQGNAGYRLVLPYAVGSGPIPNQTVLIFSKP